MTGKVTRRSAYVAALVLVLAAGMVQAQPIGVVIDGQPLVTSAPPREVGGRILVGMRDIFERLGAGVKWEASQQMITATRGARVVVLWIGRNVATVDGATVPLDVPPMLIGAYTYVPVRFPSEALGADVSWLSATQTVVISTANMPPTDNNPPPPPPAGNRVEGTFRELRATPKGVVIQRSDTGAVESFGYGPGAAFRRGPAAATQLNDVTPQALQAGDEVTIWLKEGGRIDRLEARGGSGSLPPAGKAEIRQLELEGYTRPLRAGEMLVVRMEGAPGGQATFDIGTAYRDIRMTEETPGTYRGQYRVAEGDEWVGVPVIGHLVVGGAPAKDAEVAERVSLDTVRPAITRRYPAQGERIAAEAPTIQCTFDDGNGTGVDPRSIVFRVGGRDVSGDAAIDEDGLTYYSPRLPPGDVPVEVSVADLAGNQSRTNWSFTLLAGPQDRFITAITHWPNWEMLGTGDELIVTLHATSGGRSASFEIEGLRRGLPMARKGGPDSLIWEGSYRAKPGDVARNARIIGTFVDQRGVAHTETDPRTVSINAAAGQRFAVNRPKDGQAVPVIFELGGVGLPGRTVTFRIRYQAHSDVLGVPMAGTVAEGRIRIAPDGRWKVVIDTGPARRAAFVRRIDRLNITCSILGRAGAVAETVELTALPIY